MIKPVNQDLYNEVKRMADSKFQEKTSAYKSSWIVREYKKRGGKYSGNKPKSSGLSRWYKEKWIDLNRPIKNKKGNVIAYEKCGRQAKKGAYPLCRPSIRITKDTPKTYKEVAKQTIEKLLIKKRLIKNTGRVKF